MKKQCLVCRAVDEEGTCVNCAFCGECSWEILEAHEGDGEADDEEGEPTEGEADGEGEGDDKPTDGEEPGTPAKKKRKSRAKGS